jgi:hypothetical protein
VNITPSITHNPPGYEVSYKRKDTKLLIISCIWICTCTISLIKIYKNDYAFDYFDIIWPVCIVLYLITIATILSSKTTFSIHDDQLTAIKRSIFRKKRRIYEIDRMEDMEVEEVVNKKYFFYKESSGEYIITFYYNEKEEKLDAQLAKVCADQLLEAILAAKSKR